MDFKAARETRDLTLELVSELSGFAKGTISDLENHGRGSERLKEKLQQIYQIKDSTPFAMRDVPSESDSEIWRRRAKKAERDLAELRRKLRALVSSDVSAEEVVEDVLHKK